MPPRSQANSLEIHFILNVFLDQDSKELYPIELIMISQVILFMLITPTNTSEQWGLKVQRVLIPADLKEIQTSLPRIFNDDHLITLALKRRLSDRRSVDKQVNRLGNVNKALTKLIELNTLYQNILIDLSWKNVSRKSDPELWNILPEKNHKRVEGEIDNSMRVLKEIIMIM